MSASRRRIVVIGSGPAGSRIARRLVEVGVAPDDVLVLDRARFPRQKLCGGAITYRGTESLRELTGRPAGGGTTFGLQFTSRYGDWPVLEPGTQYLYDRAHLDDLLRREAVAVGVEVREGVTVRALEPDAAGWRLELGDGEILAADRVVGADGAAGVSRRASGLAGGWTGRLVEGVYRCVDGVWDPHRLYINFDAILDGIPGYGWIFPYPKPGTTGLWKIGVMDGRGRVPGARLRAWTEAYAAESGFERLDDKLAGWPERYFHARSRAHRPGLVLVGEAWGIDPLLGEGIAPSLAMADYAARRLKRALDRGRDRIPLYEKRFLAEEEGANLVLHGFAADRLYGPNGARWLRALYGADAWRELLASGRIAYGRSLRQLARFPRVLASVLRADRRAA